MWQHDCAARRVRCRFLGSRVRAALVAPRAPPRSPCASLSQASALLAAQRVSRSTPRDTPPTHERCARRSCRRCRSSRRAESGWATITAVSRAVRSRPSPRALAQPVLTACLPVLVPYAGLGSSSAGLSGYEDFAYASGYACSLCSTPAVVASSRRCAAVPARAPPPRTPCMQQPTTERAPAANAFEQGWLG